MRHLTQLPRIDVDVNLKLTMAEVQALEALAGYGIENFLKVFYQHMGKHYLQPHEKGLRSLFDAIRGELPPIIRRYKSACEAFTLANPRVLNRRDYEAALDAAEERGRAVAAKAQQAAAHTEKGSQ